jgi:hypothetical protein
MSRRPVVVDGSNLATEGRSLPSLAQLDEAVRAWLAENPDDEVIVVVDASFGYRIDESERQMFEEAEAAGEVVSPPAGALGRGDGFLLRIADRVDAAVLSNDSFQEFHGEFKWLFDSGRLMGGKPVPGVGWIFTPRTPVRGPKSRMAVRDAQRAKKPSRSEPVVAAIEEAKAEAMAPKAPSSGRRPRRRGGRSATADAVSEAAPEAAAETAPEAVNDPLPFITFIAEHRLGTEVEGRVESFTSHGAFVEVAGARCYVPVSGLGDPPPRTAKAVLTRGEVRTFVVQALDPPRRGIELALPGLARVAGSPTDETVEAEIDAGGTRPMAMAEGSPAPRRRRSRRAVAAPAPAEVAARSAGEPAAADAAPSAEGVTPAAEPPPAVADGAEPPRRAHRRRSTSPVAAGEGAPAALPAVPPPPAPRRSRRPAVPPEGTVPPRAPRVRKAVAQAPGDETTVPTAPPPPEAAEQAVAEQATAKKAVAKKAVAKKAVAATRAATATKMARATAAKKAAGAKKTSTAKKAATPAAATAKKATAKKTVAKKAAAKKAATAKKASATKTATRMRTAKAARAPVGDG